MMNRYTHNPDLLQKGDTVAIHNQPNHQWNIKEKSLQSFQLTNTKLELMDQAELLRNPWFLRKSEFQIMSTPIPRVLT